MGVVTGNQDQDERDLEEMIDMVASRISKIPELECCVRFHQVTLSV